MGHLEVLMLLEMSKVGPDQGTDGLDDEEEPGVDGWELEVGCCRCHVWLG